jgi:signal transduction histidine kinase
MIRRSQVRIRGMRKMIADLLDLTRIESGQKKRELSEQNIFTIAKTAIETIQPSADEKGITVNLIARDPIMMNCDSGEIEIVLNNLLSNGVKYNRDNGKVDLVIKKNKNLVTFSVTDTGIGMTKEECDRLFGEFVRIKNDKTRNILGSGLGLSIVKKIAAMYNGSVSVTSTPDMGSTFTVTLQSDLSLS